MGSRGPSGASVEPQATYPGKGGRAPSPAKGGGRPATRRYPRLPSLWVMVQRREADRAWVATVCNLEPEPPAIGTMFDLAALAALAARDIRAAWIDAGDGKGYRRWGCDMSEGALGPGMNEIELLPVDGGPTLDAGMIEVMSFHEGSGTVRWEGGGWLAKIVEMELA